MWTIENNFAVRLGGNLYINTPKIIVYKGESLFTLRRGEDGMLGIDFDVYDARGKLVALFRKGVVVKGDATHYDIRSGHEAYEVVDRASGRTIASVKRRGVHGAELEVSARMYMPNGFLLDAGPGGTNLGGMHVSGSTFENCGAAIMVS